MNQPLFFRHQVDEHMRLACDETRSIISPDQAPWVVLSHGGGQTRHAWQDTAGALAREGWNSLAYDHRGHCESSWSSDGVYTVPHFAQDQLSIAGRLPSKPVLVGASLGGLSSLLAQGESALEHYRAIVLVDITPQMDRKGAMDVLAFMESSVAEGFETLDEVADVISVYTGRSKRVNPEGLRKNLRLCDDGRYRWHWDPAFLNIRDDWETSPERLIKAAQNIDVPMMLVRGRESDVVTLEVAEEFLQLVPNCEYVDIRDAGHMVAGDRNTVFTDAVVDFLKRLPAVS
ncbi:2-succinyl-6-hydroxy-2,4-cyclohexadiene-1-carboxylate synthase [BD1-7 clade bacterium]|uniref:2-succinyl-6-hydroxy-2,4-cyclohexadiene-1-carboxy late synthase n=1 Tax=BD1-7 clade bacterium TaxID=2029982 RepID=A0A5S9QG39_9GAMM|nr:2-succinyl-6-hydroxy-2,4-cyclohexadiene-1-carboxylate synthase [BD1-7 clade bacterium]CAA0116974.1 2-succinyl-6-hydroxy-2,4-cyclohexadiene-1-carboxylate synthase [BD1-7 clade bacterium]